MAASEDRQGRATGGWTRRYRPEPDAPDEAFAAEDDPRPLYGPLLEALERHRPTELTGAVRAMLDERRVTFGEDGGLFNLDPVPRLIEAEEWARLESGLAQRARALDAFAADAYGERRIFAAGGVPERVLAGSRLHEPSMSAIEPPGRRRVHVCGFDLARRADGRMVVLEDNTRTPSGHAYATAARDAITELLDCPSLDPRPIAPAIEMLAEALRGAAPEDVNEPCVAVITDGPRSSAFYEHRAVAEALGARLVGARDLEVAAGRLWARGERGRDPVDVVYRRSDDSRLTDQAGRLTALGAALDEPMRRGSLGVVNAFGSGIADDKLTYAYGAELIGFYLGEQPLIDSIHTYDLAEDDQRRQALERVEDLVVKPRFGSGGERVLIVGEPDAPHPDEVRRQIEAQAEELVAQERISLSTHPCVVSESLEPRRIDLRPFAYATASGFRISPGGLTRYAPSRGSMVVNSSRGGGAKDTWVLP